MNKFNTKIILGPCCMSLSKLFVPSYNITYNYGLRFPHIDNGIIKLFYPTVNIQPAIVEYLSLFDKKTHQQTRKS